MGLRLAQDLGAWNILVIYLEPRNTALSNKCAGQRPTPAAGDKTTPPPPALDVQQHQHKKSSQSTCWNYFKLKPQPQHDFPLFLLFFGWVLRIHVLQPETSLTIFSEIFSIKYHKKFTKYFLDWF